MNSPTPSLEVITGPMYSGKSEELIRRLNRARIARLGLLVFRPEKDARYHKTAVASSSGQFFDAIPVRSVSEMADCAFSRRFDVLGIDEAQFFDPGIIEFVHHHLGYGKKIIISGLDTDFQGLPFGCMPYLLAIADKVIKLSAICTVCGQDANHTYRKGASKELILVGSTEMYEARCRNCFQLEE